MSHLRKIAQDLLDCVSEVRSTRTAGILQAPPRMVEAIFDWAMSVTAGHELTRVQQDLEDKLRSNADLEDNLKDLQRLFDRVSTTIRESPGVKAEFAAYKEVESHPYFMVASGYPVNVKLKDFSNLRKAGELTSWWDDIRSDLQKRIDHLLKASDKSISDLKQRIKSLKKQVEPGFKPSSTYSREFPVDLRDWRYEKEFAAKMDKIRGDKVKKFQDMLSASPGMDILSELIEAVAQEWKNITVTLEVEKNGVYAGNWHPFNRNLTLVLPWGTSESRKLLQVVRHELQHMAQTFMTEALGRDMQKNPVGMPSSKVRTPEYNQNMGAGTMTPELLDQKRKIMRRLQSQGVDSRGLNFHSMDDIEFMTKLADSIDDFNYLKDTGAIQDLNAAVLVFTGQGIRSRHQLAGPLVRPDEFFATLKRFAPGKYKVALKEFVKAVF